jgi:hypothetical protein
LWPCRDVVSGVDVGPRRVGSWPRRSERRRVPPQGPRRGPESGRSFRPMSSTRAPLRLCRVGTSLAASAERRDVTVETRDMIRGSSRNPAPVMWSLTHGSVGTRQTALAMPATGDVEREPATARPKRLTTSTNTSAPPSVHRHQGRASPIDRSLLTAPVGARDRSRRAALVRTRSACVNGLRPGVTAGTSPPKRRAGGATGARAASEASAPGDGIFYPVADLGSETTSRVGRGPERLGDRDAAAKAADKRHVRIFAHWSATTDLEGNPIGAAKDCDSGVLRWTAR